MDRVRTWLKEVTDLARSGKLGTPGHPELRICMGNTSCDMDSCVGCVALAWYHTIKSNGAKVYLPVINSARANISNNLEVSMHFKEDSGIPMDHVYYMDELNAQYSPEKCVETILVDHNLLDVTQSQWGNNVTAIVDHHIENGAYMDTCKSRVVRFIGSACSLVALMYEEDLALFE